MVNKVILVGRVGKDPEVKHTPSGTAVVSFSLATSETYKDKSGNKQEKTEWHNIVAWNKLAEIIGKYVEKGQQIYCEGKITTRKWQDQSGNDRYTTEIVIHDMKMLGGKKDNKAQNSYTAPQPGGYEEPVFGSDDDIPF